MRLLYFLFIFIFCFSFLPIFSGQAQTPKSIPITFDFIYPKISIDTKDLNYLKVNTGSVVYWFSRFGASDLIYSFDGQLIGSRKWRLNADTLFLDVNGQLSYIQSDYRCTVTRFLALPTIKGNITITYDVIGEQAKTTITVASGALAAKPIANLSLSWINQVQKSVIVDDALSESNLNYSLPGGRYIAFDWSDVTQSLGDVATTSISTLSTSEKSEISFELGSLGVGKSITIDPTDSYTSAGTFYWICPAGVTSVDAKVWGAGASGGSSITGDAYGSGGGGGGAYARNPSLAVTPGGNYTVVVGAPGAAVLGSDGEDGGQSYFGNTSTVQAGGGVKGLKNANGTGGGNGGTVGAGTGYSGGKGGDSGSNTSGGGGEGAGTSATGGAGTKANPGLGGSGTDGGDGGNGGAYGGPQEGVYGTASGGGGGGSSKYVSHSHYSGAGAVGKVILSYIGLPVIQTTPATNVAGTTATLNGEIGIPNDESPTVTVYWGDNDGGTDPGSWDNSSAPTSPAQPQGAGTFYKNITGLTPGTESYFSAKATNSAGTSWGATKKFVTIPEDPSLLHETAQTNEGITEAWTKGAHADKSMLRYNSGASAPTTVGEGTQAYFDTASSYETTGLTSATQYSFSVWSEVTIDGMQQYSSGYVSDSAYTRPDAPSGSAASNPTINTLDVSWTKAARSEKTKIRSSTVGYPTTPAEGNPVYFDTGSSTTASGFSPNTQYYFSLFAEDDDSGLYSTDYDTATETTLVDAPTVTTGIGEVSLSDTSAQINGEVTYTGGENPTCTFYMGSTDGGTDPGSWDGSHVVGAQGSTFSHIVDGLTVGNTYYYTVYGISSGGDSWATPSIQFTMGCLEPGNLTASLITDYRIDVAWTKTMPVTVIRAGLDNPPANMFDGLSVYRGNGTSVSIYGAFSSMSGNLTLRAWADCTTCLACSSFKQSDSYSETWLSLVNTGGGNDTLGNLSLSFITNSGTAESAAGIIYLGGVDGIQVSGSGQVVTVTIGGESVEAINSTLWVWLALALALGLSFLSLKAGAYMWFVSCWPWVALATLVSITWLQGVAILMAVVCLGLFVIGIGSKRRRG